MASAPIPRITRKCHCNCPGVEPPPAGGGGPSTPGGEPDGPSTGGGGTGGATTSGGEEETPKQRRERIAREKKEWYDPGRPETPEEKKKREEDEREERQREEERKSRRNTQDSPFYDPDDAGWYARSLTEHLWQEFMSEGDDEFPLALAQRDAARSSLAAHGGAPSWEVAMSGRGGQTIAPVAQVAASLKTRASTPLGVRAAVDAEPDPAAPNDQATGLTRPSLSETGDWLTTTPSWTPSSGTADSGSCECAKPGAQCGCGPRVALWGLGCDSSSAFDRYNDKCAQDVSEGALGCTPCLESGKMGQPHYNHGTLRSAGLCVKNIVAAHEHDHFYDLAAACKKRRKEDGTADAWNEAVRKSECKNYKADKKCLEKLLECCKENPPREEKDCCKCSDVRTAMELVDLNLTKNNC